MNPLTPSPGFMLAPCLLAGLCLLLCSCKKDGLLLNEKQGKVDISTFIISEILKYGGSNSPSARSSTVGITSYVYSEDKDGFQVVCTGNKVAGLLDVLKPHFGEPALTRTNANGLSSFVYAVPQTGVAVTCGLDSATVDGKRQEVTHMAVVRAGVIK